jgi:hypothetical protein
VFFVISYGIGTTQGKSAMDNQVLDEAKLSKSKNEGDLPKSEDADVSASSAEVNKADPLASSRARGIERKKEVLGNYSLHPSDKVAHKLSVTVREVDKMREDQRLVAVLEGDEYFYPDWQFREDAEYGIVPRLQELLKVLKQEHNESLGQIAFITQANYRLHGRTPLDCWLNGEIDEVLWAAKCHGQQIAS